MRCTGSQTSTTLAGDCRHPSPVRHNYSASPLASQFLARSAALPTHLSALNVNLFSSFIHIQSMIAWGVCSCGRYLIDKRQGLSFGGGSTLKRVDRRSKKQICHGDEERGGLSLPEWRMRGFREAVTLKCLVAPTSDRKPLLLKFYQSVMASRNDHFRFENSWLREQEIVEVVNSAWQSEADYNLLQRLSCCAEKLKGWGKGKRGHFKKRIAESKTKIEQLLNMEDVDN
ncbi:hypothetical protein Syun_018749 [Stephania yunnanensis]|uniref:Uncharacterized protein n=1 Tax=Stephania yunnanensis TaxID=152371 RepID=A0AAP0NVB2_9MAGN